MLTYLIDVSNDRSLTDTVACDHLLNLYGVRTGGRTYLRDVAYLIFLRYFTTNSNVRAELLDLGCVLTYAITTLLTYSYVFD